MDTAVTFQEEPGQTSANPNRTSIFGELHIVVEERFGSIDLGDRVSLDASKLVGFGAYGNVYEGTLHPEQTKVAVKVVRHCNKSDLLELKRVLGEVYVWSKLDHENVIKLLGITTSFDHTISIVSPLMSRGNAFDYVQNPDVDPRPLILGIAKGLQYLHTYEQGPIIHGDIKGSNVLVSNDGRALLTDFGFSHLAGASFSLAVEQRQGGTLNWMAPEYLEDKFMMTTAGDVWAFGMTTLELFTRKRPFDHLKNAGVIICHIFFNKLERPSLNASCSRLTDEWWNICLLCWHHDPSQRASISSVVENIKTFHLRNRLLTRNITHPQNLSKVVTGSLPRPSYIAKHAFSDSHDPSGLRELAHHASRYSVVLDGRVSGDNPRLRGGYALVRSGTLYPSGVAVVAPVGSGLLSDAKTTKVAVKTPVSGPEDIKAIKLILREAHLWSKLHHEHILPFLGITTDFDLMVSIVTPWMVKGNAHDYVQDRAIDPRPLIWGIVQGLHYLHKHPLGPIIHGDMKGANVVISDDGKALLHDFDRSLLRNSSFSMSVSGPQGSTLNWMAPEMLDNGDASTEADVWAFGMTALELFTRKRPFHDCWKVIDIISSILGGPPRRPSDEETYSRMTKQWWDMCISCWSRNPSLRPTMSDLVERIRKMMDSDLARYVDRHSVADETSMDPALALEEFSKLALSYGFDLSAQIERDEMSPSPSHTAMALQRKLRQNGIRGTIVNIVRLWRRKRTRVAVKTLCGSPCNMRTVKYLVEAVHALTKLHHQNVLTLSGITTKFDSKVSLVSEWMEMGSARDYVRNDHVDPRPLLLGVANGLQYLHSDISPCPIFHGALKGSNVLISARRQPLLTDFGLFDLTESPFLVKCVGTINWTPPEHLNDFKGSAAGDVWAFGMTALELFTRIIPFDSIRSSEELERRITQGPPDRPSDETTRQRLTDGWWTLCSVCWSHDPSQRPSIDEIIGLIEDEL